MGLSELKRAYAECGSDAYHPATLLSLLIYGYATGTFSSRKIGRAAYDSLAFRYIACNRHPDHGTLTTFRKRFGKEFQAAFIQVFQVARENLLSRFGTVGLDGSLMIATETLVQFGVPMECAIGQVHSRRYASLRSLGKEATAAVKDCARAVPPAAALAGKRD